MSDYAERWERYYLTTHPENVPWENFAHSFLEQMVEQGHLPKGKVLEVGCGFGRIAVYLAEHGYDVTGVDISPSAIARAQMRIADRNIPLTFTVCDIMDLSSAGLPNDFDIVVDWGAFHGIDPEDRMKYIKEMTTHLRPGGRLALRVFSRRDPDSTAGRNASQSSSYRYFFSREDIEKLFGHAYDILERRTQMVDDNGKMRFFDDYLMEKKA